MGTSTKAEPAAIVAVAGTVASPVLDEDKFTVSAWVVAVLRVILNVPALVRPSASVSGLADNINAGPSSSVTLMVADTEPELDGGALHPQELTNTDAVMITWRSPSACVLSNTPT